MLHHRNYTLLSRQTSYYKQEYSTKKPSQGTKIGSSRDQKYTLHISANSLPLDPLKHISLIFKIFFTYLYSLFNYSIRNFCYCVTVKSLFDGNFVVHLLRHLLQIEHYQDSRKHFQVLSLSSQFHLTYPPLPVSFHTFRRIQLQVIFRGFHFSIKIGLLV